MVRAEDQKKQVYKLEATGAQRALYGKIETRRAIQNVLDHVINQYKYTSLPELNAVLKQYNVVAERGSENSRTFQHNGLLYQVLDTDGKPVGVPIKASAFYSKPTLTDYQMNSSHRLTVSKACDSNLILNTLKTTPTPSLKSYSNTTCSSVKHADPCPLQTSWPVK